MKRYDLQFNKLPFSDRDIDYVSKRSDLLKYITDFPSVESLLAQAKSKQHHQQDRNAIVSILKDQYKSSGINLSDKTEENIEAISRNNTFTLITAHQPTLLTGPLYYIFKILSCINLSEHLNQVQSEFRFVPVFVSGGEDHDFDEISFLNLFNKKITWESDQSGAVGRMDNKEVNFIIEQVFEILGANSKIAGWKSEFLAMNSQAKNYGEFQRKLVDFLFGKYGLVQFSSDDPAVKKLLAPIFKEELLNQLSHHTVIPQQDEIKKSTGYEAQAYVRDINLFYIDDGIRSRIEKVGDLYRVLDTDITFKESDIPKLSEHFSPNVVLRPLTQEAILPNVAYIGGGGELSYWLDRKVQFNAADIPFPILIRRNSAGLIGIKQLNKWEAIGYSAVDLFLEDYEINNRFLSDQDDNFDLSVEIKSIEEIFQSIAQVAKEINPTIEKSVNAMSAQQAKQLNQLESRLKREIKQRYEIDLNRLMKLRASQLPNNKLQERHDNILQYLSKYGPDLIKDIKQHLPILSEEFSLLVVE